MRRLATRTLGRSAGDRSRFRLEILWAGRRVAVDSLGADLIVMLHPDHRDSPKLLPTLAAVVASGEYEIARAFRIGEIS